MSAKHASKKRRRSRRGEGWRGRAAGLKGNRCEGCKGLGRRAFVVQEEVSADHVIASEAKQSPMPRVEIASSLRSSQ